MAWEFAGLFCKLLIYFGTAMLAGGWLHWVFFDDGGRQTTQLKLQFALVGALLGFHATLIYFFAQIGLINGAGLSGMLDLGMANMMLDTPLGDMTMLRLSGFAIGLVLPVFMLWQVQSGSEARVKLQPFVQVALALAILTVALSFRLAGHVSLLGPLQQFSVLLHVLVFALWIGAIPLFFKLGATWDVKALQLNLRRFGNQALALVIVLAATGSVMLLSLLQSPAELLNSAYGQALLLKFALVLVIIAIAAVNRFRLVPALLSQHSRKALQRSLQIEIAVAMLVLIVTAYLSTLVGPMEP